MTTRFGTAAAAVAATGGALVLLDPFGTTALGAAALLVCVGTLFGRVGTIELGTAAASAGVLLAGALGEPAVRLAVATVAVVVAYDVGTSAVAFERQVGDGVDSARVLGVRAAATGGVAALGAGIAYATTLAAGGVTRASAALLLLGAVLIVGWFGT